MVINGITAILSLIAFLFFTLSLKELRIKQFIFAGVALAFTPVVFINSTTSMDYIWALAFSWLSFYLLLNKRDIPAGLMMGLAIASRITSVLLIIPFCYICYRTGRRSAKELTTFCVTVLTAAVVSYIPVLNTYGWKFLLLSKFPYPDYLHILHRATDGVWGVIGILAITASLTFGLKHIPGSFISKLKSDPITAASLQAIIIYLSLFLILPHESGYLIPLLPFTLILLSRLMKETAFVVICIALPLSSLLFSFGKNGLSLQGSVIHQYEKRIDEEKMIVKVISSGRKLPGNSVIVAGWHYNHIENSLSDTSREITKYVYIIEPPQLKTFLLQGKPIYYLPDAVKFNFENNGVDLKSAGRTIDF